MFQSALRLWPLATLLLLPGPATAADPACEDAGALYTVEGLTEDPVRASIYRAFLCTRHYATHGEARADGLPADAPVYGIPLRSRGTFPAAAVSDWKKRNCPPKLRAEDVQRAEQTFRSLGNADRLEERRECEEELELVCSAEVEGGFAIFSARYVEFRRTAALTALRVDGQPVEDPPFEPGALLDDRGITYARALEPGVQTVSFELETRNGSCRATARTPRPRRRLNRQRSN